MASYSTPSPATRKQFWPPLLCSMPSGGDQHQILQLFFDQTKATSNDGTKIKNPDQTDIFSFVSQANSFIRFVNSSKDTLKIEHVRALQASMGYGFTAQETQVYVLFNIDEAKIETQNSLLKLIEEPPKNVQFILTTTHLQSVVPTIRSRCVSVSLTALDVVLSTEVGKAFYDQAVNAPTYASLLHLCEKFTERDEAIRVLEEVVHYLHTTKIAGEGQTLWAVVLFSQQVLKTIDELRGNAQVKLSLEHLLIYSRQRTYI